MMEPSIDDLRKLLRYEPETGKLFWKRNSIRGKAWNSRYADRQAFTANHISGYKWGTVGNRQLLAHRVAWAIHMDEWPTQVDHINGNRQDNRLENLRAVDQLSNSRNAARKSNNKSGFCGVYWSNHWQRWKAHIGVNYRRLHVATSECIAAAVIARHLAEIEYGFHSNHGRTGN